MKLKYMLRQAHIKSNYPIFDHPVTKLVDNSHDVVHNCIFFAIKGSNTNGANYIDEAIKHGAKTIVCEEEIERTNLDINYLIVDNAAKILALFCRIFYRDLTKKVKLIGVTGTNGKTTITTLLMDYFSYIGENPLLIGTNGIFFGNQHFFTDNTTPNVLQLYDSIKAAKKKGMKHVIMEVSSIGIREARVRYFDFDMVVLTNVTHDHLDYHKDLSDYKFSKGLLLAELPYSDKKVVVLNKDDANYAFFNQIVQAKTITYGIYHQADYQGKNVIKNINQSFFKVEIRNNSYAIKSALVGEFNIYNILASMAVVDFFDKNLVAFADFLRIYLPVSGRMNKINYNGRTIFIDFAHTPASVKEVLSSIKEYSNTCLTVIIGCGGNRDQVKRATIGGLCDQYADRIILTNDNPRDEDPLKIIEDIKMNIHIIEPIIIPNRKQAIEYALSTSVKDEKIAILGKGSERTQMIKGIQYPLNDKDIVYKWIRAKK